MRLSLRSIVPLLALAVAHHALLAQEVADLSTSMNDARGVALGGAATAVANDLTAIGWNPAGLFMLARRDLRVDIRNQIGITATSPNGATPEILVKGHWTFAHLQPVVELVGFAQPFEIGGRRVVAAVAWRSLVAATRESKMASSEFVLLTTWRTQTEHVLIEGGVRALSGAVSFSPVNRLAVGVSAHVLHGTQRSTLSDSTKWLGNTTGSSRIEELRNQRGVLIELGALYDVNPELRTGLRLALPHTRTGTFSQSGEPNIPFEQRLPFSLSIGLAWTPSPQHQWSFDVRSDPLSSAELRDADADTALTTIVGKEDILSFHVGYEYSDANDASGATWRLGLFVQPTSIQDADARQIGGFGMGAGRAWEARGRQVDLGFRYQRSTEWVRNPGATPLMMTNSEVRMILGMSLLRSRE